MIRAAFFIGVVIAGFFCPFWLFIIFGLLYAFIFTPFEIVLIGLAIDTQFGEVGMGVWYLYTLATICILFVTLYSKPYLRFYTE